MQQHIYPHLYFHVSNYSQQGTWNWSILKNLLPNGICDRIASLKLSTPKLADFSLMESILWRFLHFEVSLYFLASKEFGCFQF